MTRELFRDDAYLKSCEAVVTAIDEAGIILDRTVFYPLGGGQPGDSGWLARADGARLMIADTRKDRDSGIIRHIPADGETAGLTVGEAVTATLDWDRRHRHMRVHSCLHLMCAVIEGAVTGGQIGDGYGRLDFNLPDTSLDKEDITRRLNALIATDHPLRASSISDAELAARPEMVRTMSVKPPSGAGRVRIINIEGVDLQPCGGTHVRSTAEIGPVHVSKIENKGRQNRRIRVVLDQ